MHLWCFWGVFAKTGALKWFWIIHIKPTKSINLMIFQPKITLEMHCQTYNRQITEVLREKEALVEREFFLKHTGETWEIATVIKLSKVLRNPPFLTKKLRFSYATKQNQSIHPLPWNVLSFLQSILHALSWHCYSLRFLFFTN